MMVEIRRGVIRDGSTRDEYMSPRGNGGLTKRHDTEKRRVSFLIWPIFDRNFNLQPQLKVSI